MNEFDETNASDTDKPRCRRRRWRRWLPFSMLLLLGGLLIAAVPNAIANVGSFHQRLMFAHSVSGGDMDEEAVSEHLEFLVDHIFDEVDGTDQQRQQASAIIDGAAPDLAAAHEQAWALKQALAAAIHAENPDRDEVQGLRAELISVLDTASAQAVDALLDFREVLTEEQLLQLHERFGEH